MVSRILKEHLDAVYGGGIDTSPYSSHSLRAGFVTEACDARKIAQTTRHESLAMIRTSDRPQNRYANTVHTEGWWCAIGCMGRSVAVTTCGIVVQ